MIAAAAVLIPRLALPTLKLEWRAFGLLIHLTVQPAIALALLVAGLVAWAFHKLTAAARPSTVAQGPPRWVVPTLATLLGHLILLYPPPGLTVEAGTLPAILLPLGALAAEYRLARQPAVRQHAWQALLQALALLLFFSGFFAIAAWGLRALFAIPLAFTLAFALSWRLLADVAARNVSLPWAALHASLSAQTALALHYWPITPMRKGLLLGLMAYAFYQILRAQMTGELTRRLWWEVGVFTSVGALAILALT